MTGCDIGWAMAVIEGSGKDDFIVETELFRLLSLPGGLASGVPKLHPEVLHPGDICQRAGLVVS